MKEGIWNKVIKDKYIPHCSVVTWFRSAPATTSSASQTWKNLLKSLHLITHWLSWRLGSGHSVLLGLDYILGLGNSSFLTRQLITELNRNNMVYLYQALGESRPGYLSDHWKTSEEIGLSGNLAVEWDAYCRDLIGAGVQLQNQEDALIWTGGDRSGCLTVKNIYCALAKKKWQHVIGGWRRHLWKWDLAQKIKLFHMVIH
jgi:hypothetical protein